MGQDSDRLTMSPNGDQLDNDPYAQLEGIFGSGYQADQPKPQGKVRDESLF
jgi:hypothetical protein